jgi:DNA-binding transcriptional ArsR family regulator
MSASQLPPDGIELTPARLKGLAHPTRIAILGILRIDGPSTASALAKQLDTNSGATSYHLRQLERHGFVGEDETLGNAKERYWRALHAYTSFERSNLRHDREALVLLDEFSRLGSGLREAEYQEWIDTQDEWGEDWQDAVALDDLMLRLTSAELKALVESLRALVKGRAPMDASEASPGAAMIHLHLLAFPVSDPLAMLRKATDGLDS